MNYKSSEMNLEKNALKVQIIIARWRELVVLEIIKGVQKFRYSSNCKLSQYSVVFHESPKFLK